MMNTIRLLASCLFLLLIISCSGSRKARSAAGASTALLRQEATKLVECLNQRDYDCLFRLHADDFEGWSPAVRLEDKPVFIEKMVKNYREGNLLVKAKIREVEAGAQQGYVYLDWTLNSLADGLETMLLDQRCLQIWRQNGKGQWQLSRSLFY